MPLSSFILKERYFQGKGDGGVFYLKRRFNEFACIGLCFTAAPFLTVLMLLDTAILVMRDNNSAEVFCEEIKDMLK